MGGSQNACSTIFHILFRKKKKEEKSQGVLCLVCVRSKQNKIIKNKTQKKTTWCRSQSIKKKISPLLLVGNKGLPIPTPHKKKI